MQKIELIFLCPVCDSKNVERKWIGGEAETKIDLAEPMIVQEKQIYRRAIFNLHYRLRHFGINPPDNN